MHHTSTLRTPVRHRAVIRAAYLAGHDSTAKTSLELDDLLRELYSDLKKLARARTRRLPPWRSLRTTALVHEAYLRLQRRGRRKWYKRSHFCADVAQVMRDIAVEYVRSKQRKKHGGHMVRDGSVSAIRDERYARVSCDGDLAVFQALERLNSEHMQAAEIVFMRFFCDMTMNEIADALGVTTRTVERKWAYARAWLESELGDVMGRGEHGRV